MLSFKQFLSEMPLIDDPFDVTYHRHLSDVSFHDRMFGLQRTEKESGVGHKPFARIGPYTLLHAPPSKDWPEHSILVKHGKNAIGHVGFTMRKNHYFGDLHVPQHLDAGEMPRFLRQHTGKRALVPGLPSKVYMQVAKHFGMPIVSGGRQSMGGKNIWDNIAKSTKKVLAVNVDTHERIPNYDPEQHGYKVYDGENSRGANWVLIHHPGPPKL